ncbi:hypothetical protein [Paraburkholderia graminis]|uniref:hypothetical protein n=1 Tax=Paraburkholderia graminis TaxID=60548 RepID=UPI002792F44F|nr:hypothetical protein [Paraburkholderia graminis]MDQ0627136.1 hypothetical protein [Paraburkholderia graminis]
MRTIVVPTIIVGFLLIAGCVSIPALLNAPQDANEVLKAIPSRQIQYSAAIRENSKYNVPYNLLIIGAGAVSIAAAIFSHGAAKGNIIAGAGLGAGVLALGYSATDRPGKSSALSAGILHLSCLRKRLIEAQVSDSSVASNFLGQVNGLSETLVKAEQVLAKHTAAETGYNDLKSLTLTSESILASALGEKTAQSQINDLSVDAFLNIDNQVTIALQDKLLKFADTTTALQAGSGSTQVNASTLTASNLAPGQAQANQPAETLANAKDELNDALLGVSKNPVFVNKQYTKAVVGIPGCETSK